MPFAESFQSPYAQLCRLWPQSAWLRALAERADQRLARHEHGDLPRWQAALRALPQVVTAMRADQSAPVLGAVAEDQVVLAQTLMQLHPWRKGPLNLAGCTIDTEWRSDWKWDRLAPHLQWQDARVLDIGCGNGYFGWRMLAAGAKLVVGVDPTLLFVMQWLACRHFAGESANFVLPLGIEDLPGLDSDAVDCAEIDIVCSMGVLYHRRDPVEHLQQLRQLLKPGGHMVLETLVLPEDQARAVLIPKQRYARMRNVWAIPGTEKLLGWVQQAGLREARLVDVTPTRLDEQRSTDWMRFESLAESLVDSTAESAAESQDAKPQQRTVEGYPAPTRAIILARR